MEWHLEANGVKGSYTGHCNRPTLCIPGVEEVFTMDQYHLHLKSEHTVDGKVYDAELHMVHFNANMTHAAVIGVFIEAGGATMNPAVETLLSGIKVAFNMKESICDPSFHEYAVHVNGHTPIDPYYLVDTRKIYYYEGSLTTPPCSEIVSWNVVAKPIMISKKQLKILQQIILGYRGDICELATVAFNGSTSRGTAELNGREIKTICSKPYGKKGKVHNGQKHG